MQVAVVGGSLGGLAAANALVRLGIKVSVFEKFPSSFEKRGSSLGYVDVPLWEYLRGGEKMMRFGKRAHRSQGAFYYGDLWQYLFDGLPAGTVQFNKFVTDLGNDTLRPTIDGVVYDAVIVADGGWSSLRHYVNGNKQPEYAGYVVWRSKVSLKDLRPGFRTEGAYMSGKYFAIMLHVPTVDGENYVMGGVAMETPESEISRPDQGVSRHTEVTESKDLPEWFLTFIQKHFGHYENGDLVHWLEACSRKGKITPQPLFEFMADEVVKGRIIVLGDAAHMASPRTAAGAHTGILDAAALMEAFATYPGVEGIDEAIRAYGLGGRQRASELYRRSKEVSAPLLTQKHDISHRRSTEL